MHTSPLPSLESLPDPPPPPPLSVITERRAGLPALRSSFPLAVYFTHGGVYVKATQSLHPLPPLLRPQALSLYYSPLVMVYTLWVWANA